MSINASSGIFTIENKGSGWGKPTQSCPKKSLIVSPSCEFHCALLFVITSISEVFPVELGAAGFS